MRKYHFGWQETHLYLLKAQSVQHRERRISSEALRCSIWLLHQQPLTQLPRRGPERIWRFSDLPYEWPPKESSGHRTPLIFPPRHHINYTAIQRKVNETCVNNTPLLFILNPLWNLNPPRTRLNPPEQAVHPPWKFFYQNAIPFPMEPLKTPCFQWLFLCAEMFSGSKFCAFTVFEQSFFSLLPINTRTEPPQIPHGIRRFNGCVFFAT